MTAAAAVAAPSSAALDRLSLIELQAALLAGATPVAALTAAAAADGPLADTARRARLGESLSDLAADIDTGNPAADLLVRALALAERAGSAAADPVEQALDVIDEEATLRRLVQTRTAQARGTARILAALPAAVWLLLVAVDRSAAAFYATPLGLLTAAAAVVFAIAGWQCMRRLTARVATAADSVDPLAPAAPPPRWRRGIAAGAIAGTVAAAALGPVAGMAAALVVATLAVRPTGVPAVPAIGGGAAEVIDLVAVALGAGLSLPAALADVSRIAPPAGRDVMHAAARRVAGGWSVRDAFADGPLALLGATLGAVARWGTPARPALRRLAADIRADRRAAAEQAAERLQLSLVFPTTLLTLPAFVLGVVPPLLWSTLRG